MAQWLEPGRRRSPADGREQRGRPLNGFGPLWPAHGRRQDSLPAPSSSPRPNSTRFSPDQTSTDGPAWSTGINSNERLLEGGVVGETAMLIVHVHVRVHPGSVELFKEATVANARQSLREPGVARFDVMQQQDDPTRFVLVEAYRTAEGASGPQRDRALSDVAGHGGADDGRAAVEREVHERRSRALRAGDNAVRVRDSRADHLWAGDASGGRGCCHRSGQAAAGRHRA